MNGRPNAGPKRDQELANIGRADETTAITRCSPHRKSWFQIEFTLNIGADLRDLGKQPLYDQFAETLTDSEFRLKAREEGMKNESQTGRAVDLWRAILQTEQMVNLFTGLFDVIGITIEETGEELTARIGEDRIYIDPGLPDKYDFLVPLKLENVHDMISYTADGKLDEFEVWRIIAVLFTPLTRETLGNPVMSNGILRKLARIEDLMHVQLLGPEAEHIANHTLIFGGGQWLVIEGLHGQAKRTFVMTGDDCIAYQKQVFKAIKANAFLSWVKFVRWYTKWRPSVSSQIRHN